MEERIQQAVGKGVTVRRPSLAFGDYAIFGGPEADMFAQKIRDAFGSEVAKVEVAKGFVNITLAREAVVSAIAEADAKGAEWGKETANTGQRVMVEYTDPNPFKEMHIGHLMSNTIGEAISRLIANEGAAVIRACYSGDVGPHVAKAIWGLRKSGVADPTTANELSNAYVVGNRAYEASPEAKEEIDALNQALYTGTDAELMEFWRKGRSIAFEAFEKMYKVLGTHFDYYFFESETSGPGLRIVKDGLDKGIFEKGDGNAVIYNGEKKGLHTLVFITGKGTPTYEAKDIGLAFLKEEKAQTDRSIIMTGTEQIGHFKVILAALNEIAPLVAAKTTHVPHGLLSLSTGKMSSREGNVITAAGFIEGVVAKASEKNSDPLVAEQVAIGAIKYMILRQSPGSNIIFDPEKSLSLEGDSGPYLQYALVRARSVLEKARSTKHEARNEIPEVPHTLERLILHFPEVVARAARELAPNLLVNYLTELSGEWNSFYAKERIIGGENEAYKLMVTRAFVQTMTNGLAVLGIPVPEKM